MTTVQRRTPAGAAAERIRTAFERKVKAVDLRSSLGQGTAVTRVILRDGLACEVEDGPWRLTVDMGEKHGGANTGPNPGVLGRAALGSCLAIGYATWAAVRGVALASLEVEVQADYDARGELGVAEVPAGYRELRYVVRVESEAPESEVLSALDEADAHSPYLDVFARAQVLHREVQVKPPGS